MTIKQIKKFSLFISFFIILFGLPISVLAENCEWQAKSESTGTAGGTVTIAECKDDYAAAEDSKCGKKSLLEIGKCCCEKISLATSPTKTDSALFTIPDFQVKIPGLDKLATITCRTGEECNIPWIGQYINGIYNYAFAIVGILAAIILMVGGVMWIISAGDASKVTQAKELIIGSISGLIILTSSYFILNIVNPDLVNLKGIDVASIREINIGTIENGSDSVGNALGTCASDDSVVSISGLVSTSATSPYLMPDAVHGLSLAISEAAKQNKQLYVTSAFRTAEHQKELWDAAMDKYGSVLEAQKWVAPVGSCGGHRSGKAIDVCIKGTESCNHIGGKANSSYNDADVEKLKEIMRAAGWVRYCAEWWHYQYNQPQNNPCP